jgi:hypothetical protein
MKYTFIFEIHFVTDCRCLNVWVKTITKTGCLFDFFKMAKSVEQQLVPGEFVYSVCINDES